MEVRRLMILLGGQDFERLSAEKQLRGSRIHSKHSLLKERPTIIFLKILFLKREVFVL